MTDNASVNPNSGAAAPYTFRFDALAGNVLIPITKLDKGADGVSSPITDGNPLPTQEIPQASSLLLRIFNLLTSPMGFDRSLSRQRVTGIVESGTVTTVTTVTTLTGLTNIDGRNGAMLINQTNLSAWANCVRARIT